MRGSPRLIRYKEFPINRVRWDVHYRWEQVRRVRAVGIIHATPITRRINWFACTIRNRYCPLKSTILAPKFDSVSLKKLNKFVGIAIS